MCPGCPLREKVRQMAKRPLKVLIVDDEEIVRNGLKNIIDWNALGCQICGEASNGEEALEKITSLAPSIVMLDITMPVMTGIELLSEVHHNPTKYPNRPNFLILSGYSDFDYAQKALNYGAKGYIVKPVDEDLLEQKVKSLVEEINKANEMDTLRNYAQMEETAQRFSQMFLFGAVDDAFSKDEDTSDKYKVAIVSPELCGCGGQLQALKAAIKENFGFTSHLAFPMDPVYIILFKNEGDESIKRHLERFCIKMQKNRSGSLVALGESGTGLQGALDSYNQAKELYGQLFFFTDKAFITHADLDADPNSIYRLTKAAHNNEDEFFECIPELIQFIEIYDLQKISTTMDAQEQWLRRSCLSVDQIKKICMAFIVETQNAIHNKHPEKELETVPALDLVNLIYTQNYFDEMICIVKDFTMGLAESFTSNTANSTILKVIQYVKTNFNTDLKLEMLGNLFNCNSAYLGKKFREYTGVPFNTYLDIIRIEEAKKLLTSSKLKIYEISKLVGYSNTDYFYLKFKKHTNMTPKEFKTQEESKS